MGVGLVSILCPGRAFGRCIPRGKPWYSHRISGKQRRKSEDCPGFAGSPVALDLTLLLLSKSFARKSFLPLCYHPSVGGPAEGEAPRLTRIYSWFEHGPVHKSKVILAVATCSLGDFLEFACGHWWRILVVVVAPHIFDLLREERKSCQRLINL